jgi:hypothetical protein
MNAMRWNPVLLLFLAACTSHPTQAGVDSGLSPPEEELSDPDAGPFDAASPDATSVDGSVAKPPDLPAPLAVDCTHRGSGRSYDVGDGRAYASVGAVPWHALGPGDTVRIHYRAEPYREAILLSNRGTEAQPIRLCGVPGPQGQLPVLDGDNATASENLHYISWRPIQDLGLILIGNDAQDRYGDRPGHIVIEGLVLRGAHEHTQHRTTGGELSPWDDGASAVYVANGDHITVRGCVLTDCGSGMFVLSKSEGVEGTLSRDILVEGNAVYGNGAIGQDRKHNMYLQALGTTVQFNRFGRLRDGAIGGNLKDRSAGTVVRYNWFEGGARMLDLVDAQEHIADAIRDPRYRETFVYGNVFVNRGQDGGNPIHYGGDTQGFEQNFRKGTLYFYHNTMLLEATQQERYYSTMLDVPTVDETVDFRNNVVWVRGTTQLRLLRHSGILNLGTNWISTGWVDAGAMFDGAVNGRENLVGGTDPGLDPMTQRPLSGSPLLDRAEPLAARAEADFPVTLEYAAQNGQARAILGLGVDLGAFEEGSAK